jgi:hypothetical protein
MYLSQSIQIDLMGYIGFLPSLIVLINLLSVRIQFLCGMYQVTCYYAYHGIRWLICYTSCGLLLEDVYYHSWKSLGSELFFRSYRF